MKTRNIYLDCDNTMGLPGCDMDDGMALLYLLGQKQISLKAVTTSFGNSTIEEVHRNTERMFQDLQLGHIPLKKGAGSPAHRQSEASRFLAAEIFHRREHVTLLVIGSPSNIYAACLDNEKMLSYVDEIVFMGGITEPLSIGGKPMEELNFASDPEATHYLLNCPVKKTIVTAQICLADAFFDERKMQEVSEHQQVPAFAYMKAPLQLWYDFISRQYGVPGFHVWDIVAAAYITNPKLFDRRDVCVSSSVEDLKTGFLKIDAHAAHNSVNIPQKIQDLDAFWQIVFDSWRNVKI
ncbi:MAG: nucleoside hydrolase [bacterium]|nr:nucleoside hydrolase [bacterium]